MRNIDVIAMGALLVDRIASVDYFPEVDGETFVESVDVRPGGSAANFAVGCSRLGLKSGFIGTVGEDSEGDFLREDLRKEGVDTVGLVNTKLHPTGQVFIALDREGKRMMFAFSGAANALSEKDIDIKYIASSQFLHIADLRNIEPLAAAAKKAQDSETKVSLNPGELIAVQGYDQIKDLLSNVDIFISSRSEINQIYRTENLEYAIRKILKSGPEIVVITLGSEGCIVGDSLERLHRIPAFKTEVADTTGAGDAFCAGLITMLVEGKGLIEAARFASAVAALKIAKIGARALPTRREVEQFLSKQRAQT
ncbi:MAG: carbohydrate kinase family protein [Promethearchaeati archaeon SRVP18_Atabeyarchaeia-1]